MKRQRTRWTRGLIESLWSHRKMFLNKKYGRLGYLGYPYWLIFEGSVRTTQLALLPAAVHLCLHFRSEPLNLGRSLRGDYLS